MKNYALQTENAATALGLLLLLPDLWCKHTRGYTSLRPSFGEGAFPLTPHAVVSAGRAPDFFQSDADQISSPLLQVDRDPGLPSMGTASSLLQQLNGHQNSLT